MFHSKVQSFSYFFSYEIQLKYYQLFLILADQNSFLLNISDALIKSHFFEPKFESFEICG